MNIDRNLIKVRRFKSKHIEHPHPWWWADCGRCPMVKGFATDPSWRQLMDGWVARHIAWHKENDVVRVNITKPGGELIYERA